MQSPPPLPPIRSRVARRVLPWLGGLILVVLVAFVAWRVHWRSTTNRQLAKIHAAGLPANRAELDAYHAAVPAGQNAAVMLEEVFQLTRRYSDERHAQWEALRLPKRGEVWGGTDREILTGFLAMDQAALDKAHQASAHTKAGH